MTQKSVRIFLTSVVRHRVASDRTDSTDTTDTKNLSRFRAGQARSCSTIGQTITVFKSPSSKFVPSICSGSHSDMGPHCSNEDEHVWIDNLSAHLGSLYRWSQPSAFYAVFYGHGGSDLDGD